MDSSGVLDLFEQLDDDLDDLEDSLAPIIKQALSETTSKLPLLDQAKLYVLVTYAIESILFSYLRLNGVQAREHPVFKELTRVKQYFDKIKLAEAPTRKREVVLDKGAAARFIKSGLSGNDKYDLHKAEQLAKERAKAHIRFQDGLKTPKTDGQGGNGIRTTSNSTIQSASVPSIISDVSIGPASQLSEKLGLKRDAELANQESETVAQPDESTNLQDSGPRKKRSRKSKKNKKGQD